MKHPLNINAALFLAGALLLGVSIDPFKLGLMRVNNLAAPLDYLLLYSTGASPFDREQFLDQLLFYQSLSRHNPGSWAADVSAMMGFCHFYLGDRQKALVSYKHAVADKGFFFWYRHNLAVIYFLQEKYGLAIEQAGEALSLKSSDIPKIIMNSPVLYRVKNMQDFNKSDAEGVELGARRAVLGRQQMYRVLVLSLSRSRQWNKMANVCIQALKESGSLNWFYNYYLGLYCLNAQKPVPAFDLFLMTIKEEPSFKGAYEGVKAAAASTSNEALQELFSSLQEPAQGYTVDEYLKHYPLRLFIY